MQTTECHNISVGTDVRIAPEAIIRYPQMVQVGDHVTIDPFTIATTQLSLGSYIHIAPHCSIIGGPKSRLVMHDCSALCAGCRVIAGSDDFFPAAFLGNCTIPDEMRNTTYSTVTIERFATLGTNVVVLPGVTIGEGAIVWAGALVSKDLAPWGIYRGTPAKRVASRPKDKVLEFAKRLLQE
ncbi:MAG: acyltransferase [Planctomycetia bacterium]|nr:acyltransferase [Planctomycetia bacterium]